MITYVTGKMHEIVPPIIDDFKSFVEANTDANPITMLEMVDVYLAAEKDTNIILAKDGDALAGFYTWRPFAQSAFLLNSPDLNQKIEQAGFNVSELYNPILLMVGAAHRRMGISTTMANMVASNCKALGYKGRVFYFITSESVNQQRLNNHAGKEIVVDYLDAKGGQITILPLE